MVGGGLAVFSATSAQAFVEQTLAIQKDIVDVQLHEEKGATNYYILAARLLIYVTFMIKHNAA